MSIQHPAKLAPLFNKARYKVLYGGRGSAKSWSVARALLIRGVSEPIRVLCARETQKSIAESVHQLLRDQIAALGFEDDYTVLETEIRGKNGTQFYFAGLRQQSVSNLKSFEGVDICWVEEAQVVTKRSWEVLVPTIRKPESEIWVTFNPELDTDETYKRFVIDPPPDSIVIPVNWNDNPWFPEVLRKEKDEAYRRDPVEAETIWGGKCRSAVPGAIYLNEVIKLDADKRVRNVPYDPLLKTHTIWDLGYNDSTSIIMAQRSGSELRVIDYLEDSHRSLDYYVAELGKKSYIWGDDFIPHDGAAKNLQTGKSTQEMLSAMGRTPQLVPNLFIEEGIKAARMALNRTYFDRDKTARLVECLRKYRRAINVNTNEPGKPEHDEYSHGADAFRYFGVVADKLTNDTSFGGKIKYPDMGLA